MNSPKQSIGYGIKYVRVNVWYSFKLGKIRSINDNPWRPAAQLESTDYLYDIKPKCFSFSFFGSCFTQVRCFIISHCGSSTRFVVPRLLLGPLLVFHSFIGLIRFGAGHRSRTDDSSACWAPQRHSSVSCHKYDPPHLVIFLCLQIPKRPSVLAEDSHSAVQRVRQERLQSFGQPLSSVRVWLITAEVRWEEGSKGTDQHVIIHQLEILGSVFYVAIHFYCVMTMILHIHKHTYP